MIFLIFCWMTERYFAKSWHFLEVCVFQQDIARWVIYINSINRTVLVWMWKSSASVITIRNLTDWAILWERKHKVEKMNYLNQIPSCALVTGGLTECMTDSSLCPAITVLFYAFLWGGCLLVGPTCRVLCSPLSRVKKCSLPFPHMMSLTNFLGVTIRKCVIGN